MPCGFRTRVFMISALVIVAPIGVATSSLLAISRLVDVTMAIARTAVEQRGGPMDMGSQLGRCTQARVLLPLGTP